MSLLDVLVHCWNDREFVREWSRLRGVSIAKAPITMMIDQATGNDKRIMKLFVVDVIDLVWNRMELAATTEGCDG